MLQGKFAKTHYAQRLFSLTFKKNVFSRAVWLCTVMANIDHGTVRKHAIVINLIHDKFMTKEYGLPCDIFLDKAPDVLCNLIPSHPSTS